MEIWQLNTFRVVAENLHFTKASEELNLTQSAVSYQIKSLEDELGVKLFFRNKRRITLTPQGEIVLEYAYKLLHQVDVMKDEIQENRETLSGEIKIIAATRSLESPFPKIQRGFQKIHRDIKLSFFTVLKFKDGLDQVKSGNFDIGFTIENKKSSYDYNGLLVLPWGICEILPVVGRRHPLAGGKNCSLEDLSREEWFLFERGSWLREVTDGIFRQAAFQPKNVFETNDGATILSMVRDGYGMTLLPTWGIHKQIERGALVAVKSRKITTKLPLKIVALAENRSRSVEALINYLLETEADGIRPYRVQKITDTKKPEALAI